MREAFLTSAERAARDPAVASALLEEAARRRDDEPDVARRIVEIVAGAYNLAADDLEKLPGEAAGLEVASRIATMQRSSFAEGLSSMSNAGEDADFTRLQDEGGGIGKPSDLASSGSVTPSTALLNALIATNPRPRMLTEFEQDLLRKSKKEAGERIRARRVARQAKDE